jgi:hypothetical protein
MPAFSPSFEDFLEEGWGIPEAEDDLDGKALILPPSPALVTRFIAALEWPTVYLCPANPGAARMVSLWGLCKATRRPFDRAVKDRGLGRGAAYALRDRGLSLISQGLTRDGVSP